MLFLIFKILLAYFQYKVTKTMLGEIFTATMVIINFSLEILVESFTIKIKLRKTLMKRTFVFEMCRQKKELKNLQSPNIF